VKNRLAVLFALTVLVPAVQAQTHRRPSLPPPPQSVSGCPPLATLFSGVYSADVEVDDTYVYFSDDLGGLYRMPKGSPAFSTPELLGTVPDYVLVMSIDAASIYMITIGIEGTLGSIWSMPKSGGTPKELVNGVLTPYELALDANNVYWVSIGTPSTSFFLADGKIERVAKDGTGRRTLASNLNVPTTIDTDGTNVYFSETGLSPANSNAGLRSVPAGGGSVKKLTNGTAVVSVLLQDSDIFFSALNFITGGELLRMNKSSTTPKSLLKDLDVVPRLGLIDDRLYFFNSGDAETLEYIPANGGARHTVVDNDFLAEQFVLDACSVYTVDGGGSIVRTPR
jgi:hypothetical protein